MANEKAPKIPAQSGGSSIDPDDQLAQWVFPTYGDDFLTIDLSAHKFRQAPILVLSDDPALPRPAHVLHVEIDGLHHPYHDEAAHNPALVPALRHIKETVLTAIDRHLEHDKKLRFSVDGGVGMFQSFGSGFGSKLAPHFLARGPGDGGNPYAVRYRNVAKLFEDLQVKIEGVGPTIQQLIEQHKNLPLPPKTRQRRTMAVAPFLNVGPYVN